MAIGYLGYAKLANVFLLCSSTGLNRVVNPLMSSAVWGAGWYNAAQTTNYADSQMSFEGGINFEIQGTPSVWNLVRDWLIEQRAYSKSCVISPNGMVVYDYTTSGGDIRSGVWCKSTSFSIDSSSLITCATTGVALKRNETVTGAGYAANKRTNVGSPTNPLNPSPRNLNPIPGWNAQASVVWPNAPAFWSAGSTQGMVLMKANINVNNNTQIIRGCTGDLAPVAVIQGVIQADGSMDLWRDGGIPDPYGTPGNFTATAASVDFVLGGTLQMHLPHLLLTSDTFDVQGQNNPTMRSFGIAGLGDGSGPPFTMDAA